MSNYLLEIGVEELPYKFIPMAISQLEVGFKTFLESNNVGFENIKVMATPRRLAVIVSGLVASQPDVEKVVKGPIATVAYDENKNLTPAGLGFAKKNNVEPSDLYVEDNYLYAKISIKGKNTADLLKDNVPQIFAKLQGPHFMRWGSNDVKFSRPIRWVLSILDNEEIKITIKSNRIGFIIGKGGVIINSLESELTNIFNKKTHFILTEGMADKHKPFYLR